MIIKSIKNIIPIILILLATSLFGDVNFNFVFDEELIEKNDQNTELTYFIKTQFKEAGKILGSYLNYDQSADVYVILFSSDADLAGAAFSPLHKTVLSGFYNTIIGDKIQYGIDYNNEELDAVILYNLRLQETNLSSLTDEELDEKKAESQKVIIHELIHTLGFSGTLNSLPTSELYAGKGVFSNFDFHVYDKEGIPLWTYKDYNTSTIREPGYFAGPKTKEAFFNLPLPLPFQPNSADPDYYHSSNSDLVSFIFISNMMNNINSIANDDEPLCLSSIEVAILQDIGFDINMERAICKNKISPKICLDPKFIKDPSDIKSIFLSVINALPQEEQNNLHNLLIEEDSSEDFHIEFLEKLN